MPPSHGHFFVQGAPLLKCPHRHSWLVTFLLAAGTLSILSPIGGHSGPHHSEAMLSPLGPQAVLRIYFMERPLYLAGTVLPGFLKAATVSLVCTQQYFSFIETNKIP